MNIKYASPNLKKKIISKQRRSSKVTNILGTYAQNNSFKKMSDKEEEDEKQENFFHGSKQSTTQLKNPITNTDNELLSKKRKKVLFILI